MGLLNKKNIAMAKKFADKNKDKIAAGVKKATDTIDDKTGGKHADKLKKIDDAAQKYAGVEQEATLREDPMASPDTTTRADETLRPEPPPTA